MAHRILAGVVAGLVVLAAAPAARASLVYVRHAASASPEVWAARDGGGHRHRIGAGFAPVISADGARVAWRSSGRREAVWIAPADGSGRARRVVRAASVGDVALSPDGTRVAVALPRRLVVFDAGSRRALASAPARVRGLAFSPDSAQVAFGVVAGGVRALEVGGGVVTDVDGGRSLNPVWGPDGTLVFDRLRPRRRDAPVFQLWALDPGATAPRQVTHMKVPSLLSGLVPLELAADGHSLLAQFTGQDTAAGFTVDLATGRVRALSRRLETGFVAADLSADGRTVLGTTGGPDPGVRHDVVTVPFRGGRPTVLVRDASQPRFTR
jgi:hypothetical protein